MPHTETQLLADALQIKQEVIPNANSAERVGTMFENIIKTSTKPYDSVRTYEVGQYIFFGDSAWRCVKATLVGESPSLVPTKWKKLGLLSLDQIVTDAAAQFVDALPAVFAPDTGPSGFLLLTKKVDGSFGVKRMAGNDAWAYLVRQATGSEIDYLIERLLPGLTVTRQLRLNPYIDQAAWFRGTNANLVFCKENAEPWNERGMYFINEKGPEKEVQAFIGWDGLANFFSIRGARQLQAFVNRVLIYTRLIVSDNVQATTFSTSTIPVPENAPTHLCVATTNKDGGVDHQYIPFAPFQQAINSQAGTYGEAKAILCQTKKVPVKVQTETRWIRLTPDMLDTPLNHPLGTVGDNIIVSMRGSDNRPQDVLDYSFPDTDHVRFTLPDAFDDWTGGSYKLEKIQS